MSQATLRQGFLGLTDLNLWFRIRSGDDLTLSDVPEIISLRWTYFRESWEFIVDELRERRDSYPYPDLLDSQINDMDNLISVQRNSQNQTVNPFTGANTITRFYAIWQNVEVTSLPVNREELSLIEDKINTTQRFIKTDFQNIRDNLIVARDGISDDIGLSDSTYNTVYDRSSSQALRTADVEDISNMQQFQRAIKTVDFILANTDSLNTTTIDPFALARANAQNPEVFIETGRSGRLVNMFFGDSLQDLAARHLGDADRWVEISIANGLKTPYIDEVGEAIAITTNGSKNQLNLPAQDAGGNDNINKLYINQPIFLQSDTIKFPDQRTIVNIKEVPVSGEIIIELDGEPNLSIYKVNENATIRVFKPNTTNSNFLILIPLPEPVPSKQPGEVPFFLEAAQEDEKLAGVDFRLNDDFDLAFNSTSDLQLNFGLANAVQAMQIKILSEQGQNPRHTDFGLPQVAGTKANDPTEVRQALITGITDMVDVDFRFDRIEQLAVGVLNGQANINLVVRMAGSGSLVPISFTINTG